MGSTHGYHCATRGPGRWWWFVWHGLPMAYRLWRCGTAGICYWLDFVWRLSGTPADELLGKRPEVRP